MNHRRAYEIAFVGLKPGVHSFEYQVDSKFFTHYGDQDFSNCKASIKLQLEKNNAFMLLTFDVDGRADVNCDRCGNSLNMQLWDEFKVTVKMVEDPETMNNQEEDPDVFYLARTESHLYVGDWIYEFINLSIPMQRMCSEEEMGGPQCNKEVLEKLKKMQEDVNKENNTVWKGLEKFKNMEE
ncbi:MAG TPA: DUF177 domain-containing protein [Panacibacter sp.]|nr:DUF177 domain-containing protein [Panacibacter sp.]HNP43444.1 DUF177 domain-containing protein [Panacibacter sp.]